MTLIEREVKLIDIPHEPDEKAGEEGHTERHDQ